MMCCARGVGNTGRCKPQPGGKRDLQKACAHSGEQVTAWSEHGGGEALSHDTADLTGGVSQHG